MADVEAISVVKCVPRVQSRNLHAGLFMPYLEFKGRKFVENHHSTVGHYAFEFDARLSILPSSERPSLDGNLIIEGDNLKAIKSLLPTHAGRIKCVYMDPPYNTGNEGWVYNDNLTQPQFKEWIGKTVGNALEDATRHDKWCCMMMPRLKVIQQILSNDGVVFISIDDVEVAHLRSLMNDVFGEHNFLAQLVWEKSRKNDAKFFSLGHEYILVYARSLETLKAKKTVWREEKPGAAEILQFYQLLRKQHGADDLAIEEELRNWYRELPKNHPSKKLSRYKQVDRWGPWRDRDISWPGGNGPRYLLFHPLTDQPCAIPNSGWRFSEAEMHRQIDIGLVVFRDDHTEPPMRKRHLVVVPEEFEDDGESEVEEDDDLKEDDAVGEEDMVGLQVMPSVIYKQSQVSVKQLRRIMGKKAFNNPKDPDVLARLIRYTTSDGDIILDCTAGSGTTAHAVLQINLEEENNRRFILTQQKHDSKEDEKKQVNICQDITRERVKRVIEGKNTEALGGSFTYARLSETPVLGINRDLDPLPSYEDLARTVFYTHTSQSADETLWNRESGYLGERSGEAIFLLYDPHADIELGLERAWLDAWGQGDPRFHLVVYSEKFAIHRDDLREWCEKHGKTVTHLLVPYEIK